MIKEGLIAVGFVYLMIVEWMYLQYFMQTSGFGVLLTFVISFLLFCVIALTMAIGVGLSIFCLERKETI